MGHAFKPDSIHCIFYFFLYMCIESSSLLEKVVLTLTCLHMTTEADNRLFVIFTGASMLADKSVYLTSSLSVAK